MQTPVIGLFVGLALGAVLAFSGFSDFVLVAAAAVIGFLVGKVLDGQIDLTEYLGAARRRSSS